MSRRHLFVSGRVQGVFFRDSCRREAERLGVSGWVRNLADGRVEVVAEGPDGAVAELEQWCATGPAQAMVSRLEGTDEPAEHAIGFRIR